MHLPEHLVRSQRATQVTNANDPVQRLEHVAHETMAILHEVRHGARPDNALALRAASRIERQVAMQVLHLRTMLLLRSVLVPLLLLTLLTGRGHCDPPPLRIGIVGLVHGHVAGFLGTALQRPDIKVVGIAEADAAVSASYRDHYQLAPGLFYPTVDAMLEAQRPEAVVIYTATADHRAVVESCARRGIPVMMEKPLAFSLADAHAIATAAHAGHIAVLVNYETTWYPATRRPIRLARTSRPSATFAKWWPRRARGPSEIGVQPEFLAWLTDPARNGDGALTDFGCYGANLMTWLMGNQRPLAVTAVDATTEARRVSSRQTTRRRSS